MENKLNFNEYRHNLLELLSDNYAEINRSDSDEGKLGISFDSLSTSLEVDRDDLELICSKLYEAKEILYTDTYVIGVFLTSKGASSLTDEKYLNIEIENELRGIELNLANSNVETNRITKSNSRISLSVAIVTLIVLFIQIGLNQYNESIRKELKGTVEQLNTKNKELKLYSQKVDSLTFLLSQRKNKELLMSSKNNSQ